jgi:uridine monophosphate synthetase
MAISIPNFAQSLFRIQAIRFGDFLLKSGKRSPVYLDLRCIVSYPALLEELAEKMKEKMLPEVQRICGVPYAALPLATAVSLKSRLPLLMKRKETKAYGTAKLIEGEYAAGDQILLIEDVVTSGESLLETIAVLEKEGLHVAQILTIVDREQGGLQRLHQAGYKASALFTISGMLNQLHADGQLEDVLYRNVQDYLKNGSEPVRKETRKLPSTHVHTSANRLLEIARLKKSNLIASVDLCRCDEVLAFLQETGHALCAAKLHVDMLEDFSMNFIHSLKKLAAELNFMLIEDRKFADIGNTQLLQLSKGIYSISQWADFVTIHLIAGEAALKAIQDWKPERKPGLIPIIEMSSEGALTGESYQKACAGFLYNYPDVVGLVCQKYQPERGLLKFTPGINLADTTDARGQQYNHPEYALKELGADFIIIGRGLYSSSNPGSEVEKYLQAVRNSGKF